ncbi:MAG TPA: hypothetical protein VK072_09245 [Candidatus Avamphibacillus sp.]|nr:hypothetical protein [Candidatus Avamphibacillus sp.]
MLHQWHHLYEEADERQGPAFILLSGTSYASHLLHYHIEHEPNWLLTSIQQKPNLKQQFLPV